MAIVTSSSNRNGTYKCLFSLLRTSLTRVSGNANVDYVSHAKQRLRQQAAHLGGELVDQASNIGTHLKTEAGAMTDAIKERSAELADATTEKVQEWAANVGEVVREFPDQAVPLARQAKRSMRRLQEPEARDNLLLGIAGLAVLGALGAVYRRHGTT